MKLLRENTEVSRREYEEARKRAKQICGQKCGSACNDAAFYGE